MHPARAADSRGAVLNEVALVARMARQDKGALKDLYHLYSKPLYSYAYKVLQNKEDVEECLQDAFVRLWAKAATYDPTKAKPFAWAVLILRGICFDRLRRRGKVSNIDTVPLSSKRGLDRVDDSTIESLSFRETTIRVKNALSLLEPEERQCLEMAVFGETSHSRIAATLNKPLGTVKSHIRRGLIKLRTLLEEDDS